MYLDLTALPRCGQRWEGMRPVEGGRLCASCDRVIVDFRRMSPAEIAERHAFSDGPVCGLYSPGQLGQAPPSRRALPVLSAAASLAALLGVAAPAAGQTSGAPVAAQPADSARAPGTRAETRADSVPPADTGVRVIRGTVRMPDGSPVAGAMVMAQQQRLMTTTDARGEYVLRVAAEHALPESVQFVRLGFAPLDQPLPRDSAGTVRMDAVMDPAVIELSAFYVTGATQPGILRRLGRAIRSVF